MLTRPIAVLGLDGATWDVIDPLLAQGRLPNLSRLMERGAYGRIATLQGYTSPALWATIMTGKLPSKHGVRDFYSATGCHLKVKPIYEILDRDPVGLFQMYASRWQAHRTGFMVPSRIEGAGAARPHDLGFVVDFDSGGSLALMGRLLRYGVPPWVVAEAGLLAVSKTLGLRNTETWQLKTEFMGQRFRGYIAAHLIKNSKPAFFASLFYLLDHLGHYYWRCWEPSCWTGFQQDEIRQKGKILPEAYMAMDSQIGRILRALPPSSLVVVVSDHGMEKASGAGGGKPLTIKGNAILTALDLSGKFVTELVPPFESVFRARPPGWTPAATRQLIHDLANATLVDGTRPFCVDSPNIESVIVRIGPELGSRLGETLLLRDTLASLAQFVREEQEINGTHSHYGILILSGEGVQAGKRIEDRALADVTPTLLALSGQAVARDMDGVVVEDALTDDFLVMHPIQFVDTYEDVTPLSDPTLLDEAELRIIEDRLRRMGYLA